jgi:hypothetical protein
MPSVDSVVERRRAVEELRQSEERYPALGRNRTRVRDDYARSGPAWNASTRAGRQEEADQAARLIVEANERMDQLLDDLLAYTQLNLDEECDAGGGSQSCDRRDRGHLETAIEGSGAVITYDLLPKVQGREAGF